jgi:hypothetical protein
VSVPVASALDAAAAVTELTTLEPIDELSAEELSVIAIVAYLSTATRRQIEAVHGEDSETLLITSPTTAFPSGYRMVPRWESRTCTASPTPCWPRSASTTRSRYSHSRLDGRTTPTSRLTRRMQGVERS